MIYVVHIMYLGSAIWEQQSHQGTQNKHKHPAIITLYELKNTWFQLL